MFLQIVGNRKRGVKEPPFFQTPVTENSCYFNTYIKIRNSNSTAVSWEEFAKGINCGISIDVFFCFDELPNNKLKCIVKMMEVFTGKSMCLKFEWFKNDVNICICE